MAWAGSSIFRATTLDVWDNATAIDQGADSFKAALYNNTTAPDNDVTSANTAYNVGQWTTSNEVSQAVQWPAGGVAIASTAITAPAADTVMFDGNDTASGSTATLASVFGCLVYDDTITTPVADQGISYHYFGGTQSVTSGTFTIVWHTNGINRWTVAQA